MHVQVDRGGLVKTRLLNANAKDSNVRHVDFSRKAEVRIAA